ncbi:tyrosine-type recombinase/integrase [Mycoplasma sp. T363T]|uniref:Tyrosine-type recombinase/integrase n=1 Tax=Mycoplasma bradburyae TaxID=2963128 RepID=A0ABT5GC55_9MOLU|nr:site-specific tyrosine recombinase/integron integrase [Mycoplasma bradburyae]MDC4163424.1 tyrosine-type recombinase/integrase [Mycoplasma bradburyae]MDC4182040.1 tyrosine-type recombinase/integrase [Mycoplasma bradburyae]UTS70465.1 tyrosine-type recombinase/integrase [Mycoplasma bradburyae]
MQEQIKLNILNAIKNDLNNNQLSKLKQILDEEFNHYDINKKEDINDKNDEFYLDRFISAKRIEGCSNKTLLYYYNTISTLLNDINKRIVEIATDDIREYLIKYSQDKQLSRITIDNIRRIFATFFSWLEDEDYILKSPVRRIKKVKSISSVKEIYSDEELELMRDSCNNPRDLAIIDMLISTGMRIGEMVSLNISDINFHEREFIVLGKGNKQRVVYFDARTKLHLLNYLKSRKDKNLALFVGKKLPYNRITIGAVETMLRKIGKSLNIGRVHPHKFRRTMATVAIDKGMPIEQVQSLLGHKRIDTTLQYAMVKQSNVKIAHRKYIG